MNVSHETNLSSRGPPTVFGRVPRWKKPKIDKTHSRKLLFKLSREGLVSHIRTFVKSLLEHCNQLLNFTAGQNIDHLRKIRNETKIIFGTKKSRPSRIHRLRFSFSIKNLYLSHNQLMHYSRQAKQRPRNSKVGEKSKP